MQPEIQRCYSRDGCLLVTNVQTSSYSSKGGTASAAGLNDVMLVIDHFFSFLTQVMLLMLAFNEIKQKGLLQ